MKWVGHGVSNEDSSQVKCPSWIFPISLWDLIMMKCRFQPILQWHWQKLAECQWPFFSVWPYFYILISSPVFYTLHVLQKYYGSEWIKKFRFWSYKEIEKIDLTNTSRYDTSTDAISSEATNFSVEHWEQEWWREKRTAALLHPLFKNSIHNLRFL